MPSQLDVYLSATIRTEIETRYYARINAQARLEQAIQDPVFLQYPREHIALYADHGVVHVRDVATRILEVLDAIHGLLIPARSASRLAFMKGYGVAAAYLHDIGMVNFSAEGRAMHPEFAAQAAMGTEMDTIVQAIWNENSGNMAWRLTQLHQAGALEQSPIIVLREILALVACHSKSKVPAEILIDPARLRRFMQGILSSSLHTLWLGHEAAQAQQALALARQAGQPPAAIDPLALASESAFARWHEAERSTAPPQLACHYENFPAESYHWLVSSHQGAQHLACDVVDTLRALRCADALRQRGTVFKTSANYEVFVDRKTANAIFALRHGTDPERLFLLELTDVISAGEANIAGSELRRDGNLHITFHRGRFGDEATTRHAAHCAAWIVNDIQRDVVGSFLWRSDADSACTPPPKSQRDIGILLEGVDDNPDFAEMVRQELVQINPQIAGQARTVPSLQGCTTHETTRYLEGQELSWSLEQRLGALEQIAESGHQTAGIDPRLGFEHVKVIHLQAGDLLVQAGAPAGFVYIPLADGLEVFPLGGYQAVPAWPWQPLGITGVIRGAPRNATAVAQAALDLLVIPSEVFLRHWHRTYTAEEFRHLFLANQTSAS